MTLATVIRDPRLRMVHAHWNEIRGDRPMPARSALDPRKLAPALSIIFVCDYEPDGGRLRYRLAGEDVQAMYPIPLRGRCQDELFSERNRAAHLARVQAIVATPGILYAEGELYGHRRRLGGGERLILPLAEDGRTVDAVLGATAFAYEPHDAPADALQVRPVRAVLWSLDGLQPLGEPPV